MATRYDYELKDKLITKYVKVSLSDVFSYTTTTILNGVQIYITVGYKGASAMDAGLFYCPYVPLQMVRAVGENTFQPKIGFKTRYGMVANPFSRGATASDGTLVANTNVYYRRVRISNLF